MIMKIKCKDCGFRDTRRNSVSFTCFKCKGKNVKVVGYKKPLDRGGEKLTD